MIDTSVAVGIRDLHASQFPGEVAISSLTLAELVTGPCAARDELTGSKLRGGRAIDLMIAATALAHDLPLYTRNAKDLRGCEDLIEIVVC